MSLGACKQGCKTTFGQTWRLIWHDITFDTRIQNCSTNENAMHLRSSRYYVKLVKARSFKSLFYFDQQVV